MIVFFFFKQKTAYEMRISDWSSDVCSSDLRHTADELDEHDRERAHDRHVRAPPERQQDAERQRGGDTGDANHHVQREAAEPGRLHRLQPEPRSEEHTSELQSLMRISYAVFCLKKKNKRTKTKTNTNNQT